MRLTQKGQVTVPKSLRDRYGLKTGMELEFEATEGGVLLRPAGVNQIAQVREAISAVRGTADAGLTTAEVMDLTRGQMTLVDANILIDLFTGDPDWADWSAEQLAVQFSLGSVGINPIIYAESSIAYRTEQSFRSALNTLNLISWDLPYAAAFLAGKAFVKYRRSGGERRSPLPDFYIGAHAMVSKLSVLTRDPQRYRTYFPDVKLICP